MKRITIGLSALLVLSMVTLDLQAQQGKGRRGGGQNGGGRGGGSQTNQATNLGLTNVNSQDLMRMWEEEKLARDVYISLAKTSNLPIFRNISSAESRHMQALEQLLRASGANSSALNSAHGVFVVPEHQQLFKVLVASGSRSPLDAVMVGAKVEEMDIADLQRLLAKTTNAQVRQVLEHLMRGSRNHLRAFASQISQQGATYNAEFLSQAEFNRIATSPAEKGQGRNSGTKGQGRQGQGAKGQGRQGRGQRGR